jgi:hypothetical protein
MASYLLQGQWTTNVRTLTDYGSGAHDDVTVVFPNVPDGWFFLAPTALSGLPDDKGKQLIVRPHPDTFEEPLAEFAFAGWAYKWGVFRNNSNNYGLWTPKRVPEGYVCLGDMFWYNQPPHMQVTPKAVSQKCVVEVPVGACIWSDHGTGAQDDGSMWSIEDGRPGAARFFVAQSGYDKPRATAWALNWAVVEMIG